MELSRAVAGLAFVGLVPALLFLAYRGAGVGLYPSVAIPVVFGVALSACLVALFAGLPVLRKLLE